MGDGSLYLEVDRPSRVHAWKILFGAVLFFFLLLVGTYYFFFNQVEVASRCAGALRVRVFFLLSSFFTPSPSVVALYTPVDG